MTKCYKIIDINLFSFQFKFLINATLEQVKCNIAIILSLYKYEQIG